MRITRYTLLVKHDVFQSETFTGLLWVLFKARLSRLCSFIKEPVRYVYRSV